MNNCPRILTINGGSASIKLALFEVDSSFKRILEGGIDRIGLPEGGPAVVANTYLESTYSEVYPSISPDKAGLQKLFLRFSFFGDIPSHASPETPGFIYEGGELGYSLSHSSGAVFDNPNLIVGCMVGDGEAETGPLATAWHSNKFLDPITDGAVLPILHLNGDKTRAARISSTNFRTS